MFEFDWTEAFRSVGRSPFLSAEKYDLKKGCQGLHANPFSLRVAVPSPRGKTRGEGYGYA